QMAVIKLAADRTPFIDQGQSMNLHIRRGMSVEELSRIHFAGWALGVKTFYYCRSVTLKRGGIQSKIETRRTVEVDLQSDCVACEG
ncbi:MAG: ribonucleotide-diphosphate reductase subunit alpha, partial [Robiginitomaculum sp.]|nr:ribonucleotide-diphosphate reductase subunit alpha [Robiginitomaculum sp.]